MKDQPKKRRSKEENRQRLMTAGAHAFAALGVNGARIADIANDADVATGTFYLYFDDKEQMFADIMREGTISAIEILSASSSADTEMDDVERNRQAMARLVDYAHGNQDLFRLLFSRVGGENPLQRQLIEMVAELRTEQLREGKKTGRFRAGIDPLTTAIGEAGFFYHLIDWWLSNPEKADREQVIETLVQVRMFGVEARNRP